jgi:hypothetical protein
MMAKRITVGWRLAESVEELKIENGSRQIRGCGNWRESEDCLPHSAIANLARTFQFSIFNFQFPSSHRSGRLDGGGAGRAGGGGGGFREHGAEGVVAGAALVADAAALQIANGRGAVVDRPHDVPFVFAAADADDHVVRPWFVLGV